MAKICYIEKKFQRAAMTVIDMANELLEQYADDGFVVTLRQLYYRFVANGWIENTDREYKRLGRIISDARMAGLIDWDHLQDRTRNLLSREHFANPAEIIEIAATQYAKDLWAGQDFRPEVWIEKDALIGVIEDVCDSYDVPHFSCRGYVSMSEMWTASQRMIEYDCQGQSPIIFHLGDHDPSGVDMTRDIAARLETFCGFVVEVRRIALNMDQVRQYGPPPNPAKIKDSRSPDYIEKYGRESWELDALEPSVLIQLVRDSITEVMDDDVYNGQIKVQERERTQLELVSNSWDQVAEEFGDK